MLSVPADQSLFIFAHQDDEMAAASRIMYEVARGAEVFCAYLTDGSAGRASAGTRNRETLAALKDLGIPPERVFFPGSTIPLADGTLPEHLEAALLALESAAAQLKISRIYCLAWEGGHQDHDASHLVAAAFAARRGIVDRCYELPLYRAAAIRHFFRVLSPANRATAWHRRTLRFREALRCVLLVRHYPSQRGSWIGLFPEFFTKTFLLRRELHAPVDLARLRARPHRGTLLYESRYGYSRERFEAATVAFIRAHLS